MMTSHLEIALNSMLGSFMLRLMIVTFRYLSYTYAIVLVVTWI